MDDLPALLRKVSRITFFFLSIGCVSWVVWPAHKTVFGGFMLGAIGSLVIAWHLAWKLVRIGNVSVAGAKPRSGFGFLSRAALALLVAFVSVRMLEFNLPATVAGLIATPLATLLLGLMSRRRRPGGHSTDERGEKH
ncbi:ATP synthase subunit I [Cohnella sp. REN36]|uniref:ATP synthase subunit I n=1 Tax=Cohnella sp. REN36 TaxID=2887347 RepID=UPI001D15559A|nr:ATP synthase subunit I [Cohnella sp. REN36]MCC3377179.1 ATP synthase subunit I [Cohnella sp. REN36]